MSKFKCKKHGVKGIILVSPDVASNIKKSISIRDMALKPVNVETVLSESVLYWLSDKFISKYNSIDFDKEITLDYLDEIGESDNDFLVELKPVCSACFKEAKE